MQFHRTRYKYTIAKFVINLYNFTQMYLYAIAFFLRRDVPENYVSAKICVL